MTNADRLRGAANRLTFYPSDTAPLLSSRDFAYTLADLLEDVAAAKDAGEATIHPRLLDLADLILGGRRDIRVGDPATPLHAGPNCGTRNAQDWECTQPKGHDGPHVACDTENVVAVWS
jgi:hypothetical protein